MLSAADARSQARALVERMRGASDESERKSLLDELLALRRRVAEAAASSSKAAASALPGAPMETIPMPPRWRAQRRVSAP